VSLGPPARQEQPLPAALAQASAAAAQHLGSGTTFPAVPLMLLLDSWAVLCQVEGLGLAVLPLANLAFNTRMELSRRLPPDLRRLRPGDAGQAYEARAQHGQVLCGLLREGLQVQVSAVEPGSGVVLLAEATPYSGLLLREGVWRERALAASSALPEQVSGPAAVPACCCCVPLVC
jgi:hypothetical protein